MAKTSRIGLLLVSTAALLVGSVVVDVMRRAVTGGAPHSRTPTPTESADTVAPESAEQPTAPASTGSDVSLSGGPAANAANTAADSARHAGVRERIRLEGDGTYLAAMLAGGDSMLRRWPDERGDTPLRVAVIRQRVDGFREDFVANVHWAIGRWNGAQLPVQLESESDTARADIVVTWVARMDSNRTGRADVTWDTQGRIQHAAVTLVTHSPDGRLVVGSQMVALALHELGHALGLGHSPIRADALFPQTAAIELTERDRRTARLLYSLPAGSFR